MVLHRRVGISEEANVHSVGKGVADYRVVHPGTVAALRSWPGTDSWKESEPLEFKSGILEKT